MRIGRLVKRWLRFVGWANLVSLHVATVACLAGSGYAWLHGDAIAVRHLWQLSLTLFLMVLACHFMAELWPFEPHRLARLPFIGRMLYHRQKEGV